MMVHEFIAEYRQRKQKLDWLDANCWIGVPPHGRFDALETAADTRAALAEYGIQRAIVSHTMARDYGPVAGNEALIEAIHDDQRFYGAAVIAPDGPSDSEFRNYVRRLIAGRVRMIRVFPRMHNFVLSDWCMGRQLSVLEELRIPLVIWHIEASWEEIASVCRRHPRLPVIVEGPERKLLYHNRAYCGLFEAFPNFHLEIHNLVGYQGLDDVVRRFGSQRLVFGSYFPRNDPNAAMMLVTHGDFADEDRENIAHRNIERLMAEVDRT
jgi:uncharacterized protein